MSIYHSHTILLLFHLVFKDKEGDSALHNAVVKGFEDIVKYLVRHARVNKDLKNNKAKTAEVLAKQKKKANKIYALFK